MVGLVDVDMPRGIEVCGWLWEWVKLRNPMQCFDWWRMVTWQMWSLRCSLRLHDLDNVSYPNKGGHFGIQLPTRRVNSSRFFFFFFFLNKIYIQFIIVFNVSIKRLTCDT